MSVVKTLFPFYFRGRIQSKNSYYKNDLNEIMHPSAVTTGYGQGASVAWSFFESGAPDPGAIHLFFSTCFGLSNITLYQNFIEPLVKDKTPPESNNKGIQDLAVQTDYEKEMLKLDGSIDAWQKKLEKAKQPLIQLKQEYNVIQQEIKNAEADLAKMPTVLNELKLSTKKNALTQHEKLIEQAQVLFEDASSKINAHLQKLLIAKENRRLIERQKQVHLDHQKLTHAQPSEADQKEAQALLELSENTLREMQIVAHQQANSTMGLLFD